MENVQYLGQIDRLGINELYGKSILGLCVLMPIPNYINSQPIKMYEYMAAGLPFICSDFPLWKTLVEETEAGICVPPTDIHAIREAILALFSDRQRAQEMGRNGRRAVEEKYSWEHEGKKLLDFYEEVAGS